MSNFLVTYDLNHPVQDYPNVLARLEEIGTATRVLYSAWVLETSLNAREVINHLAADDIDDGYFVATLSGEWSHKELRAETDMTLLTRMLGKPI